MSDDPNVQPVQAHGTILPPGEAADRLGIGAAMLRRHVAAYEKAFAPLPRDERGARQYPIEVVQRLQHASDLYRSGTASSVADALDLMKRPGPIPTSDLAPSGSTGDRLVRQVLTEVQAMNADRQRLDQRLDAVLAVVQAGNTDRERLDALLDGLTGREDVTALQQRVIDLQDEVRDLQRRNQALVEELRRRGEPTGDAPSSWWSRLTGSR